jgi:molybdopterin-guanine dinucleotide biosynthesis protein A
LISIAILCGGKSKRFGGYKIFHKINGKTILELVYEKFKAKTDDVFLQLSSRQNLRSKLSELESNIQYDLTENVGPLGGIYSALNFAQYEKVFIIAGDLPFIDIRILDELLLHYNNTIIIPRWIDRYLEPLCAIYSKEVLPVIQDQIERNDLKISNLYRILEENYCDRFSIKYLNINRLMAKEKLKPDCFRNINTIEDLKCH